MGSPRLGLCLPEASQRAGGDLNRNERLYLSRERCRKRTRKVGGISFKRLKCCSVTQRFCQACVVKNGYQGTHLGCRDVVVLFPRFQETPRQSQSGALCLSCPGWGLRGSGGALLGVTRGWHQGAAEARTSHRRPQNVISLRLLMFRNLICMTRSACSPNPK